MILRSIRQAVTRDLRAKALALASVMLASALITALLSIALNISDQMAREMASFGANLEIIPQGASLTIGSGEDAWQPLRDGAALESKYLPNIMGIYWRNNIMGFTPWLEGVAMESEGRSIPLIGTAFDQSLPLEDDPEFRIGLTTLYGHWLQAGRWPADDAAEVSVGARLARSTQWAIGDQVMLRAAVEDAFQPYTITAIHQSGGGEDDRVMLPLPAAQALLQREGDMHAVRIRALAVPEDELSRAARRDPDRLDALEWDRWYCTAYVSSIAHQLDEVFPNGTTRPVWQIVESEGAVIRRLEGLLLLVTLTAALVAGVGVASFVNLTVLQRQTEIALMKALGATSRAVFSFFLGETLLLALTGALLGVVLGTLLAQGIGWQVFQSFVPFSLVAGLVVVLAASAIALLATLTAARRIAQLDPAALLHEAF